MHLVPAASEMVWKQGEKAEVHQITQELQILWSEESKCDIFGSDLPPVSNFPAKNEEIRGGSRLLNVSGIRPATRACTHTLITSLKHWMLQWHLQHHLLTMLGDTVKGIMHVSYCLPSIVYSSMVWGEHTDQYYCCSETQVLLWKLYEHSLPVN